ncbi:MAG: MFS transporter, partial [Candidatus Bathyarchaeia archaeon]
MYEETVRSYLGLFLLGLLSSFGSVVSPVLPQYAEHLGASYGEIGLFFSAYSLTWSFLQLYTGYLSDRYGRKRFAMLGLSIYGFSLTLMGSSQNFMQLIIFRVLQGVGLGVFGPSSLGLVAQLKGRGKSFALYRTSNSLGSMLGPVIGGIIGRVNLSYPFYIGGLL